MLRAERQKKLVDIINQKGFVTVEELMAATGISKATARRDINEMADEGLVDRVRGGAKSIALSSSSEPSFIMKSSINADEKRRIAEEAVKHISPGDRIVLDSGTTVFEVARLITTFSDLTVITNDIHIANELNTNSKSDLIFIGGSIRKGFWSSYGYFAEFMLNNITADKIFLSVDAISPERGVMSYTMDDINLKRIGMENAQEVYLLCDHSKFKEQALFTAGMLDMISTIITGEETSPEILEKFRSIGKNVVLV